MKYILIYNIFYKLTEKFDYFSKEELYIIIENEEKNAIVLIFKSKIKLIRFFLTIFIFEKLITDSIEIYKIYINNK